MWSLRSACPCQGRQGPPAQALRAARSAVHSWLWSTSCSRGTCFALTIAVYPSRYALWPWVRHGAPVVRRCGARGERVSAAIGRLSGELRETFRSRRPLRGTNANVAAKGLLSELKSSLRSLRLSRQASPRRLWPLQRIETAKWPALFYTRLRVRRVATAASHAPGSRALSPNGREHKFTGSGRK